MRIFKSLPFAVLLAMAIAWVASGCSSDGGPTSPLEAATTTDGTVVVGDGHTIPDAELRVNNIVGVVVLRNWQPYRFSYAAHPFMTACGILVQTSNGELQYSGVNTVGASGWITMDHPYYPRPGRPVFIRFMCTDGLRSVEAFATVIYEP